MTLYEVIGTGAYGCVFKAKCDDLVCAAKCLYQQFCDGRSIQTRRSSYQAKSPERRFLDEIELLASLKHPNIVQYLGVTTYSNGPILLMELLDECLTHFLNGKAPLPLPTELSICHDIALALSYLHSRNIIHRDLSSNNVLMLCGQRAKVSDFGMAKLYSKHDINAFCPGTRVYMPPEVFTSHKYTDKVDCFSFGMLVIQVITRSWPSPTTNMVPQSEFYRRVNDIAKIPDGHVLRDVARLCLNDCEQYRPSARDLCSIIDILQNTCKKKLAEIEQLNLTAPTAFSATVPTLPPSLGTVPSLNLTIGQPAPPHWTIPSAYLGPTALPPPPGTFYSATEGHFH